MLDMHDILERIGNAFAQAFAPESQFYWLFLLSAAGIAFILYWLRRYGTGDVTFKGFLAFCFPREIYAHPSARLDFKYFVVNTVLFGVLLTPLLMTSSVTAFATASLLETFYGFPTAPLLPGGIWADVGVTALVVVFADIAFFVSHFLQHRIGFLWEFHKVHHSAEVLQPITLYRRHPLDAALDVALMGTATGLILGISAYVFGDSIEGVTILGTNAVSFLFHFAGTHLRHSHIRLSYGPVFDRILISPTMHQIHHGCSPEHVDKNFGGLFSVWDWLAGTLYLARDGEELLLGLPRDNHGEYNTIFGLYTLPFVKNALRLQRFTIKVLQRRNNQDI